MIGTLRVFSRASAVRRPLQAGLFLTTALAGFAAPQAQAASPSAAMIEEIVVTAQRREQSLQQVPIAVTAFGADALERTAVPDITYLNQMVPNATFKRSRATNSTLTAFIRGVGQQDPVAGFEGGVGLYLDDVYLNRPQGAVLDVYDVERIEVLRGPQGTLYGRNTIGGAIKYVTKRIGDEPEFKIRGSVGNYAQTDVVASFGMPLTEGFRVGGAFARLRHDGYGKNTYLGQDNYNKDVWAARGSVELSTDSLFVRITGDTTEDDSNPRHGHRLLPSAFPANTYPVLDDVYDTRAGLTAPPKSETKNRGAAMTVEWTVDDSWTVKNILAYRDNESGQILDFDSLPVVDLDVPYLLTDEQTSEEIQILYNGDGINGIAGFYYLDANAYNEFDVILGQTGALIGVPGLNAYTYGKVDTKTWSLFGDVTVDLGRMAGMEGLELSLGGRYTSDKRGGTVIRRTYAGGRSAAFGGSAVVVATTSNFTGEKTFKDFTPRAVLAYKPDDVNNLYASFSQGFKGGGFDPRGQTTAAADLNNDGVRSPEEIFEFMQFDPENITTYELGWKTTQMDGRFRSSLAGFYSDYKDVQVPGSIGVDTNNDGVADNFSGVTTNAGKARFWGVEWEASAVLAEDAASQGDSLTAAWTLGWIDAKYKEFITAVTVNGQTSLQNVADQRFVQNTPEWTLSGSLNYTVPAGSGELSFIPAVSYRSKTHQFEYASPIDQPGYALVDASVVWTADDGGIQVGLHGKNLTDKKYKVAGYDFVTATKLGLSGVLTAFYGDPMTVTGTVSFRF